jgi:hypothetical protein
MSKAGTSHMLAAGSLKGESMGRLLFTVVAVLGALGVTAMLLPTVLLQLVAPATVPGGSTPDIKRVTQDFEITLEFEVRGTNVSGSGIMRNAFGVYRTDRGLSVILASVTADAIPMRLPSGDILVATLKTPEERRQELGHILIESCGLEPASVGQTGEEWLQRIATFQGACPIDPSLLPILVLFPAPAKADNAIYVDPVQNALGVKFVGGSIKAGIDAPPTVQIAAVLPWLESRQRWLKLVNEREAPHRIRDLGIGPHYFIRR